MYPPCKFLLSARILWLHSGISFSSAWCFFVEYQFYLCVPFILLFVNRSPRSAMIIPSVIVLGGIALRTFLAYQNLDETGVSFRGFQAWIYYPTWTRLDPLVFGVALAAIEKFRPEWWKRLTNSAIWLWLPGLALIAYGLYLGEGDYLPVTAAIWQFPLLGLGMAALLVCAVSPRLPFRRVAIPGAAFIASIAYSTYLVHKLAIHFVGQFCASNNIALTSVWALLGVELCVYFAATLLFFLIERPFLQLRKRLAPRK